MLTTSAELMSGSSAARDTLIYRPASYVHRLNLREMFPLVQPLEVELGAGDGSFLAQYAAAHPERNFLGVERLLGRLRKLDRKGLRAGLQNLRLLRLEASYLVEYLLPGQSVSAIHIYFPDPWPKRRHWKHRLVNETFAASLARCLEEGGGVHLRTDNAYYFEQMLSVFGKQAAFSRIETPETLRKFITDFERDFKAQGVPILEAAYVRAADHGVSSLAFHSHSGHCRLLP